MTTIKEGHKKPKLVVLVDSKLKQWLEKQFDFYERNIIKFCTEKESLTEERLPNNIVFFNCMPSYDWFRFTFLLRVERKELKMHYIEKVKGIKLLKDKLILEEWV